MQNHIKLHISDVKALWHTLRIAGEINTSDPATKAAVSIIKGLCLRVGQKMLSMESKQQKETKLKLQYHELWALYKYLDKYLQLDPQTPYEMETRLIKDEIGRFV